MKKIIKGTKKNVPMDMCMPVHTRLRTEPDCGIVKDI